MFLVKKQTNVVDGKIAAKKNGAFVKEMKTNWPLYLMASIPLLYYLIFNYLPMFGVVIAFQDFSPAAGIFKSTWVGLAHFKDFFSSVYFMRTMRNTLTLSFLDLLIGFPAPIILALLLNELTNKLFKKTVQTITYIPHFISMVIICGLIVDFSTRDGVLNIILGVFGHERTNLLIKEDYFKWIYVFSGIWQTVGWGSIVYIAALGGIDSALYEAARIDGAGKLKQAIHVTLPGIIPTIVVLFILRVGNIMSVGFEKVILLYNPTIYNKADVISSYLYREGLGSMRFSYSAAVGLFNSVVNLILIIGTNYLSKKATDMALW